MEKKMKYLISFLVQDEVEALRLITKVAPIPVASCMEQVATPPRASEVRAAQRRMRTSVPARTTKAAGTKRRRRARAVTHADGVGLRETVQQFFREQGKGVHVTAEELERYLVSKNYKSSASTAVSNVAKTYPRGSCPIRKIATSTWALSPA
jgi:hypothetical protein